MIIKDEHGGLYLIKPDDYVNTLKILEDDIFTVTSKLRAVEYENEQLREKLKIARDVYIELHSDGETDCVTPFDIYT